MKFSKFWNSLESTKKWRYAIWTGNALTSTMTLISSVFAQRSLNISRNITSIRTWECSLPSKVYQHMVTQLQQCNKLQRLDLSESKSEDIGSAVAASKSLVDLFLYNCEIPSEVYSEIAEELTKPEHAGLQRIHLNKSKGIKANMGTALAGMTHLKEFYAQNCRMSPANQQGIIEGVG